jgi:hypothetical protein
VLRSGHRRFNHQWGDICERNQLTCEADVARQLSFLIG